MLFSFAVAMISLGLSIAGLLLFASVFNVDVINPDIANPEIGAKLYMASVLGKILMTVFVILIIIAVKISFIMKPSSKGLLKGILFGWILILLGIFLFAGGFDFSKISSIKQGTWLVLLIYAVETLLAGISEEFLCRGLLFHTIFYKNKNVKKAALISSAIFGVIHLMNVIHAPIIDTLALVVFAFGFGILFAAIYTRCKNLWAVVLLHGIFNFATGAANILTPIEVIAANGITEEITAQMPLVIVAILAACLGMFLIRSKKMSSLPSAPMAAAALSSSLDLNM